MIDNSRKALNRAQASVSHAYAEIMHALAEASNPKPIDMILFCPRCGMQHVDKVDLPRGWGDPPHRSHLCERCRFAWRPADVPTYGVMEIKTRSSRDNRPIRGQALLALTAAADVKMTPAKPPYAGAVWINGKIAGWYNLDGTFTRAVAL